MTVDHELYVYSWGSQVLKNQQNGKIFYKGYLSCFATDIKGNVFQVIFQNYHFNASVSFEPVGDHPLPDDDVLLDFVKEVISLNNAHIDSIPILGKFNVHKQNLDKLIKTESEKNFSRIFPYQNNGKYVYNVTERKTTRDASKPIRFFDFLVTTFSQLNSFSELFSLSKCFIGGKEFTSIVNIVPSCQVQFLSKFGIPCTGWVFFKAMHSENISCESQQIPHIEGLDPQTFMRLTVDASKSYNIQTSENQAKIPMLRVLSFDIETFSEDGSLPEGTNTQDTVFQISGVISRGVGENTFMIVKRSSCELQNPSISDVTITNSDDQFEKSVTSMFLNRNCKDIEMRMNGTMYIASEEKVLLNISKIDFVKIRCDFQKYLFTIGRGLPANVKILPVENDGDDSAMMIDHVEKASSDEEDSDEESSKYFAVKTIVEKLVPEKMSLAMKDDCNVEVRFPSTFTLKRFQKKYHGKIVCVDGCYFKLSVSSDLNPNFDSFHFQNQHRLIDGFVTFIKRTNPHVLIGYSILQYDLKFLTEKSNHLNLQTWNKIGVSTDPVKFNEKYSNSNQKGDQKIITASNLNRVIVDMRFFLESEVKMDSYKLDSVANAFLGEKKDDLSPSGIFDSYRSFKNKTEDADKKMEICGSYCVQDSVLVTKLFIKFNTWIKIQEMSRASHSTIDQILQSGQLKRSHNCFYLACERDGFGFIPCKVLKKKDDDSKYQGATVFKPVSGKYSKVISLDFASLYPSIMIAFNLCVSTMKEKWSKGCITVAIGNHKNCKCKRKNYVELFDKDEDPETTKKPGINSSDVEHQDENISGFRSFLSVFLGRLVHFKKISDKNFVHVKSFSERCKSNTIKGKIRQEMLFFIKHTKEFKKIDFNFMIDCLDKWRNCILHRRLHDEERVNRLERKKKKIGIKFVQIYKNVIKRRLEFDEEIFKILDCLKKTTFSQKELIEKLESFETSFIYSDVEIKRLKSFQQLFVNEDKDKKVVCVDEKFYFDSVEQSISSKVLTHLLMERKKAKQLLQEEKSKPDSNMDKIQMYDNLQNAFKVMANSVYGSFGASFNRFGSKAVAMCVTALGRFSNLSAAVEIKRLNGIILYGDTDSNYVHFPNISVNNVQVPIEKATDDEIANFSKDVADRVSQMAIFRPPMKLEFENMIYTDILFVSKKRYVYSIVKDGELIVKSKGLIGARRGLPAIDVSLFHRMESLVFDQTNRPVDEILFLLTEEMLKLFQRQPTVVNKTTNDIEIDIKKLTFSKKAHVLETFDKARVETKNKHTKVMLGKYTIGAPKVDFQKMTDQQKNMFILNGLPEHVNVLHKCQHVRGEVVDSSRIEYVKLDMSTVCRKGKRIVIEKPLERRTAEDAKFFMQNCQKMGLKLDLLKIIELVAKHMDDILIKAFIRNQEVNLCFDDDEEKLLQCIRSIWPSINMHLSTFLETLTSRHLVQGELNFVTFAPAICHGR